MTDGFETGGGPTSRPEDGVNPSKQVFDRMLYSTGEQADGPAEVTGPVNSEVRIENFSQGDSSIPPED